MRWFVSDTHFMHRNILRYCDRPFDSIKEHDEELIRRWNEVVHENDTVYHLGDFALGPKFRIAEIVEQLNGHIILIRGNHDKKPSFYYDVGFHEVYDYKWIDFNREHKVLLCHYPNVRFEHSRHILLHGHNHAKDVGSEGVYNVGVDAWEFRPVSEKEILELL